MMTKKPEVWLRGESIAGLVPLLQPAANALLEAGEEIEAMLEDFPQELLWKKPAGRSSVGFHLKHIPGVLDRLLTYAESNPLSEGQMNALKAEKEEGDMPVDELVSEVKIAIAKTIERYKRFSETELISPRGVGRKQIPSNVIGLCFHAAEHTMRHTGQLLVTVSVVKSAPFSVYSS